jgi:putative glutamine amidotransferase
MTSPIIGISSSNILNKDGSFGQVAAPTSYLRAVLAAGGLPLIIPSGLSLEQLHEAFDRLDGLVLIGGGDIDPQIFKGQAHPRVYGIDAQRDDLDLTLARLAADERKPFLGICRGIQVINVALGGTLFTDIGDQKQQALRHDWYPDVPRDFLAHAVALKPDSRLAQILGGDHFEVNSLHHQGLEKIAPSLTVSAHSPDGLVEAVELEGHPFGIGVQWHPECLQEHAPQRALFSALVEAAKQN